ncbi:MAG TPA: preprotein translocase subunit SecA [Patescibacteria group bacterium]|nr:preprotein translocase subunit SecA [Patescibacteria group bacterium]
MNIFSKILDVNARELDEFKKIVKKINELEPKMAKLKEADFAKKTAEFKKKIQASSDIEKTLNEILPEAFALSREASFRVLGQKPYDVQLVAGIALFKGRVAEQKTGEGKTLSAVAPLYLRALAGKGVHLVTVNDYLARLGAGWNGPVFALLGMKVGVIVQESKSFIYDPKFTDKSHGDERLYHLKPCERKVAYEADVTYGTNNEYGFDYLRDNMVQTLAEMAQRGHYFAIVDEVDSVLIDEARTPLIISAPDNDPTDKYYKFAEIIKDLDPETHYTIDEKYKSATLTEKGIEQVEKILGLNNLYEQDFEAIHHIENALRARALYLRDREYVVKDGEVIIVDEFTGRLMVGRRWSDGLHQAVEAKEGVVIQQESKTLATISFQNYFRMYDHLSGMTGTASTEAGEFKKIYKLEVVVVPTHRPMIRKDHADVIYKTIEAKYKQIADDVAEMHKKGQPVLIGTTSIEKNEIISEFLKKRKVPHQLLNAKNHEKEAEIIAQAGKSGAVTVATNMAGRGVDIILGGSKPEKKSEIKKWEKDHEEVVKSGGLHVVGTERHESRRIDNQLRGRSGRQGDPGSSRFYLSVEDDLMRIFGGDRIGSLMETLKIPEGQPIENRLISKAIESAQVKVEGFHFDARKRVVEYDDVANQQRDIIYKLRKRILEAEDLKREVLEKLDHQVEKIMFEYPDDKRTKRITNSDDRIFEELVAGLAEIVPFDDNSLKNIEAQAKRISKKIEMQKFLIDTVHQAHAAREKQVGEKIMRQIERFAYLSSIDHLWIDHIDHIEDLRQGIELRAYGQRDPVVEFKNEAYDLFETLIDRIDEELSRRIFRIDVGRMPNEIPQNPMTNTDTTDMMGLTGAIQKPSKDNQVKIKSTRIGRNDPCPCGSGKKFKKCGLLNTEEHQRLMANK